MQYSTYPEERNTKMGGYIAERLKPSDSHCVENQVADNGQFSAGSLLGREAESVCGQMLTFRLFNSRLPGSLFPCSNVHDVQLQMGVCGPKELDALSLVGVGLASPDDFNEALIFDYIEIGAVGLSPISKAESFWLPKPQLSFGIEAIGK